MGQYIRPTIIENIIAERDLVFTNESDVRLPCKLIIGAPHETEEMDFVCAFQFLGYKKSKVEVAFGADSLQALTLALRLLDVIFEIHRRDTKFEVGDEQGYVEVLTLLEEIPPK